MKILSTEELYRYYGKKDNIVKALNGVSIDVEEGEFVAIVGTSGSGKSTLLNLIGGIDKPTQDELTIFRRRHIGFVFQNYNLIPVLNVYENIIFPIELDGIKVDKEYVQIIIETLGLQDKQFQLPSQLSGGQQQRVAIARALATKPSLILADEPTGNLDSQTTQEVIMLLRNTSQKFHQTIIMITHNEQIAQMADRIIRIEDGRVVRGDYDVR